MNDLKIVHTYNAGTPEEIIVTVKYGESGVLLGIDSVVHHGVVYAGDAIRRSDYIRPILQKVLPAQLQYLIIRPVADFSVGDGCRLVFTSTTKPDEYAFSLPGMVVGTNSDDSFRVRTCDEVFWGIKTSGQRGLAIVADKSYDVRIYQPDAAPQVDRRALRGAMISMVSFIFNASSTYDKSNVDRVKAILSELITDLP